MILHGTDVRQQALTLLRGGAKNIEVARQLNAPSGTISYWLHLERAKRGESPGPHTPRCPRCDGRELNEAAYTYLLGLYLGDGHISQHSQHRVPSLMITCSDNSKHLWCLFPRHGTGMKHERPITLEPWQQRIVDASPWEFIRGLIHSDGCRSINWTTRMIGGERRRYEYPRYWFTNVSDDIRQLYTNTLNQVGVEWKQCTRAGKPYNISVAKRASVALMDAHVGPKY
ncbi:helix-turn-helix domain-containing protein [Streptomyces sp. NPDC005408]|uniref:helix-turn-helix domain-containing protein n=1 Tax=Streptomyces sp. NPDC005408 TaxID=3155341 RepID=UPI0033ADEFB4